MGMITPTTPLTDTNAEAIAFRLWRAALNAYEAADCFESRDRAAIEALLSGGLQQSIISHLEVASVDDDPYSYTEDGLRESARLALQKLKGDS